jgi:hypothetical protein
VAGKNEFLARFRQDYPRQECLTVTVPVRHAWAEYRRLPGRLGIDWRPGQGHVPTGRLRSLRQRSWCGVRPDPDLLRHRTLPGHRYAED